MGKLNATTNRQELYEAFLQALTDAPSTGGGGSETFPDLVVTGTGGYTIPVGFNAIVRVYSAEGNAFTVNGVTVQSSQNRDISDFSISTGTGNNATTSAPNARLSRFQLYSNTSSNSNPTVNGGIISQTEAGTYGSQNGQSGVGMVGSTTIAKTGSNGGSGFNTIVSGISEHDQNTVTTQTYKLPEGTLINGGSNRLVELYAI
jgi:hypothetical protein